MEYVILASIIFVGGLLGLGMFLFKRQPSEAQIRPSKRPTMPDSFNFDGFKTRELNRRGTYDITKRR